jgi:leader peptidase (prepilin peptidase) / N-methyltransferase
MAGAEARRTRPPWEWLACATVTAGAGALAAVRFGAGGWLLLVLAMLAWLGTVAAVDLQTRRVPNRLTYPALLAAPLYVLLLPGAVPLDHLAGALLGGGLLGLAFLLAPRGIGLGDVKLALVLGVYLGLRGAAVALLWGVLLGGVAALLALLWGAGRRSTLPYAPALAAGGAIALLSLPPPT